MAKPNRFLSQILFLLIPTVLSTVVAHAAPPLGQTIWIRATSTGLFVSADQNRGTWAPLVADRSTVDAWEQFQVIDAGGGFIALRAIGTGLFVSADQARQLLLHSSPIARRLERGSSLPGPILQVVHSHSEDEPLTGSFRLI
jgi:hypothetical protein